MTLLRERTEIREVPKLQRPRRPWFGWIVSLVVLVVAGGIWLMVRDTGTSLDGSFDVNEQARFERIGVVATEVAPVPDGFDLAETQRFEGLGTEPASESTSCRASDPRPPSSPRQPGYALRDSTKRCDGPRCASRVGRKDGVRGEALMGEPCVERGSARERSV